MAAGKGRSFILAIGDGASPEVFTTIASCRSKEMSIDNEMVDVSADDSAGIQELLADAGIQSMSVSADGIFKDGASEETLRTTAFARTAKNYKLTFPNGDSYVASMLVQNYRRTGTYNGAEAFSCTLQRAADGTYTAA